MEHKSLVKLIDDLFAEIEKRIPGCMEDEADNRIANGNVAVCIIDSEGQVYGKMYGENKIRARQSFKVAWIKASQVWITGMKTGEYEKMVFNGEVDEKKIGIERPDLIGWVGGQPLTLKNGYRLSAGFSGFRGITDLDIVVKALGDIS